MCFSVAVDCFVVGAEIGLTARERCASANSRTENTLGMVMPVAESSSDRRFRHLLAAGIVLLGIVLLGLASWIALHYADSDDRPEMARLVFASSVPLLGTWIGTVLAFYFARENLEAASNAQRQATESTVTLAGIAPTTPVTAIMTPSDRIDPQEVASDEAAANGLKLNHLYKRMQDKERSRLPVFDASGAALYVVHEPDIDKYAQAVSASADALPDDHTLEKLLMKPELRKAVTAFATVPLSADVGQARAQLHADPDCKDVFVTMSGRAQDPALGWLTNYDLARVG